MAGCAPHATFPSQVAFATSQPKEGSPDTPFRQSPRRRFNRKFFDDRLRFPDGAEHVIWSFESETSGRGLPAPAMRMEEGEVVHATVEASKGPHTVHLHGIEPDPHNDGVGHTSFEVSGSYTYQWRPSVGRPGDPNTGSAGTYFYHCHVNTPLHVQMGMFGPLIVDPVTDPALAADRRRPFVDGTPYDKATETLLVPYAVDPRWHRMNHGAGLSGEDAGLHRFDPKHFYVLGGRLAEPPRGGGVWSAREVRATVGPTRARTLLRINNATYFPTRLWFTRRVGTTDVPAAIGGLIAHDGRPLRVTAAQGRGTPVTVMTDNIAFGAAERYDVVLHPEAGQQYSVHVDWFHWVPQVRAARLARVTLPIVLV